MFSIKKLSLPVTLLVLLTQPTFAMPIDWHGVFGVDTNFLDNFRRIKATTNQTSTNSGSQEVSLASGDKADASFQSYIFRLNPHLLVNDSATFKAEFTSGYARGGYLGDSSKQASSTGSSNTLYKLDSNQGQNLLINKAYIELYSDTATYLIGRHGSHFGLGAIVNAGDDIWNRHLFTRDGITMKIKLGNFSFEPYWAKVSTDGGLTALTDSSEYGITLSYDNIERDLGFGLLYSKKKINAFNTNLTSNAGGAITPLGEADVKLIDLYFKKGFGDFSFQVEVPILSGDLGHVFNSTDATKYKAKAILFESEYKISESLSMAIHAGQVSGDNGSKSSFDAIYLNPNYQVANLLFRYNMNAISDAGSSLHDSYITNAFYLKYSSTWSLEKWTWVTSVIYAKAQETANASADSFDHENNKHFTDVSGKKQADDLGLELDINFSYRWNEAVTFNGNIGYLMTGDYYAYTNDATISNSVDNSYIVQFNSAISF